MDFRLRNTVLGDGGRQNGMGTEIFQMSAQTRIEPHNTLQGNL